MVRLASVVAALLLTGYYAQADDALTAQVRKEPEPYRHVLQAELDWLTKKQSSPAHLKSYEPSTIAFRAIEAKPEWKALFPRHRFYVVTYTNRPRNEITGRFPGRLVTVKDGAYVFIVGPTGKHYKTIDIGMPGDDLVRLLKDNRVAIRAERDARRVWQAYLDLESVAEADRYMTMPGYERGREQQSRAPIRRISAREWDIEIGFSDLSNKAVTATTPDKQTFMKVIYRITLNADKSIASVKRINQPVVILH